MNNILYIVAVILIIGWLVGFVGFHAGGLIHLLLVIAVIAVLRLLKVIDFNPAKEQPPLAAQGGLLKDEDPKDSDQLQEKGKQVLRKENMPRPYVTITLLSF